ncbi:hypothetical protein C0J52_15375 [Blattella germanica]|nr:hypothetical protein C0J52_15375 [Blattella germanica]
MSQPASSNEKRKRGRPRIHSPRKKKSVHGRNGFVLRGQVREYVCSLREYFELERENGGRILHVNEVVKRAAAALKISTAIVTRIWREKVKKEKEPWEEEEEEGEEDTDVWKKLSSPLAPGPVPVRKIKATVHSE